MQLRRGSPNRRLVDPMLTIAEGLNRGNVTHYSKEVKDDSLVLIVIGLCKGVFIPFQKKKKVRDIGTIEKSLEMVLVWF